MTFYAKQTLADMALEPFDFEGLDGEIYELPNLASLTYDHVEMFEGDGIVAIVAIVAPAALAAIKQMPLGVLTKLSADWRAQAEESMGAGESSASSPSSGSTAGPSKPTSKPSTESKTRKR